MTTRGWVISVFRFSLLCFGVLAIAFLVFARGPSTSEQSGPRLLGERSSAAPDAGTVVMEGAVEIQGPDGSKLSSQTGAELDLKTGDLTLSGPSTLSTKR